MVLIAIAWVGTGVAFGSGLAGVALAPPERLAPSTAVVLAMGALSGLIMGLAGTRRIATAAGAGSGTRKRDMRPDRRAGLRPLT